MEVEETQLVVRTENVGALGRRATDIAGVAKEFVLKKCAVIQGKKFPTVEVWQYVANLFGCVGSAGNVQRVEGGFTAIGQVRRISDGVVVSEGEGFLGDDEKSWASKPMYARRAMVQTRAISRACRAAFSFILPMIAEGLETTPAEEMDETEALLSELQKAEAPKVVEAEFKPDPKTGEVKNAIESKIMKATNLPQFSSLSKEILSAPEAERATLRNMLNARIKEVKDAASNGK